MKYLWDTDICVYPERVLKPVMRQLTEPIRQVLAQSAAGLKGFTITGAIVFASVARGVQSKDSDGDLLTVAESLHPKRNRRGAQIGQIKSMFPKIPLDVLLLAQEEVVSNFRNHNPLFLDIAEEGFLQPAIFLTDCSFSA